MIRISRITAALLLAATMVVPASGAETIPRLPSGKPDFSGIWQTTSPADYDLEPHGSRADAPPSAGVVEGGFIPYLPEAMAQRRHNFERRESLDPRLKCWSLGVPRSVYYPEPFQILQRDRDLTLVHQFGYQVRTIHTNGTLHSTEDDQQELWHGDSRGRWEGDTLVVDVTNFNDETWLDRSGNYHSTKLHVVERWTLLDANTIEYRATVEDPEVFSRPWNLKVNLFRDRDPDAQLIEDYCYTLPYDEYYPPGKE